ncbi:MAG: primosomal protein N' [Pseudomonadales bacterium]|nr:primosomal protein N' [Pseudomonadales bacterium]
MSQHHADNAHEASATLLRLAVPSPLRRTFDYLPPQGYGREEARALQPGIRLRVPFGSRTLIGVLLSVETDTHVSIDKLRPALEVLDTQPLLPPSLVALYLWAAQYYQHPPGDVFHTMLPALLRQGRPAERPGRKVWQLSETGRMLTDENLRRAPRQREIVEFLREHGALDKSAVAELDISASALIALQANGFLVLEERLPPAPAPHDAEHARRQALTLNKQQQAAVSRIVQTLDQFQCHLLDGVTGSGKTEVYLQVIAAVLAQGRQALVLVPEISLTPQTIARFRQRFQCHIAVLHSGLTDSERLNAWLEARDGVAQIIIGTRSALFTPLQRPGIVILDEEHDSSFKQQDGFRYSARDLGIVRARSEGISIVLGSATPSLESLHNALAERYTHLQLNARAGEARPPALKLLDTTHEVLREGFSDTLLAQMHAHLARGNQVLVFINRRGFAPTLQCADCGWVAECTHCAARMTLHRTQAHLRCHHCDARRPVDRFCPLCKSRNLQALGLGTQRIEQFLQTQFPDTRVLRVDRDSTRRKYDLDVLLNEVHQGKPCLLIGTQMLAKGHHFPSVTLVAILDADAGLFSADFRGQEHTAQLLMQVAGRAGRADAPGEVLIQTRHATHQTLQTLVTQGYGAFARTLLEERRAAGMPPFTHLTLLRAEAVSTQAPESFLQEARTLATHLCSTQGITGVQILGPLPSPMEKRHNRFRAQLLFQCPQRPALQQLLTALCPALEGLKSTRTVRWSVDVDPQDMI